MHRLPIVATVLLVACTRTNPAFDAFVEGSETMAGSASDPTIAGGDGDGDPDPGDGDGEPEPGDGDGDPGSESSESGESETSGDGDGEPEPGDGDGEPDPGDGDGDDPVDPLCDPGELVDEPFVFEIASLGYLDTSAAPGFDLAPFGCHMFVICHATQDQCDDESNYLVKGISNGAVSNGMGDEVDPNPLQLRFWPGPQPCGDPLELAPSQYFGVDYWNGDWAVLKIMLPCYEDYGVPLYIGADGSTFWDPELTEPAALAP